MTQRWRELQSTLWSYDFAMLSRRWHYVAKTFLQRHFLMLLQSCQLMSAKRSFPTNKVDTSWHAGIKMKYLKMCNPICIIAFIKCKYLWNITFVAPIKRFIYNKLWATFGNLSLAESILKCYSMLFQLTLSYYVALSEKIKMERKNEYLLKCFLISIWMVFTRCTSSHSEVFYRYWRF